MASIVEIAKIAHVSPMTVSNVINKKFSRVSPETRERIEKIIKELNYVPNMSARSLVSNNSKIIVLAIPQTIVDDPNKDMVLVNPFYAEIINSIEFHLRASGYYLMLSFISDISHFSQIANQWNADGVILLGAVAQQLALDHESVKTPLVLIDSYMKNHQFDLVRTDDFSGGYQATQHLIIHDRKKLAIVVSFMADDGVARERYLGFEKALKEAHIPLDKDLVFQGYPTYEFGIEIGHKIAAMKDRIDGVFAYSDLIGVGIIQGLKNEGIRVPNDMAIIGFDGLLLGRISDPELTTVKQDIYEKGKKAVELLLKRIQEPQSAPQEIILPVTILNRFSI